MRSGPSRDIAEFEIDDRVAVGQNVDGETTLRLSAPGAELVLSLNGGHIQSCRIGGGSDDLLWMSTERPVDPAKPRRGGIPVCWPWFGAHQDDPALPSHGTARTSAFGVTDTGADAEWTWAMLSLLDRSRLPAAYAGADLQLHVRVGPRLIVTLQTTNSGAQTIPLTQALHTYFNIADIADVAIDGLAGCPYADALDGLAIRSHDGPVNFAGEVDRIYNTQGREITLCDFGLSRTIRLASKGSLSSVVWNPWVAKSERLGDMGPEGYRRMVCIETANAGADVVQLRPGQQHRLTADLSVGPLSKA
ncbi:MAG: D-hexose-6-phosphate mutarotase [Pseudomonadota bacterium]